MIVPFARLAAIAAVLSAGSASAQVKYQPDRLMRHGYSHRAVAPGVWQVKGSSGERQGGVAVALYRAAELAAAADVTTIRVVKQAIDMQTMSVRGSGQEISYKEIARITVRAVHVPADSQACEMQDRSRCMTLSVAGLMARFGPELGRPAALPGATPAAPARISTGLFSPAEVAAFNARSYAAAGSAASSPSPMPTTPPPSRQPVPARLLPSTAPPRAKTPSIAERLAAARPVTRGDPVQGWTIGD